MQRFYTVLYVAVDLAGVKAWHITAKKQLLF